jgi:hypothetical protein
MTRAWQEGGGDEEMCAHVLPTLTWNAGHIMISSWTVVEAYQHLRDAWE